MKHSKVCKFCVENRKFINVSNYWYFWEEELQKKNLNKLERVANINIKKNGYPS